MKIIRPLITSFLLLLNCVSFSQEQLGIRTSNYAPNESIFLNPASSSDSRVYLDFNISSFHVFGANNAIKYTDFSFRELIDSSKRVFDENKIELTPKKNGRIHANVAAHLPSFTWSKGLNGFGFHIKGRALGSTTRIPFNTQELIVKQIKNDPLKRNINYFLEGPYLTSVQFADISLNYSRIIKKKKYDIISIGVNLHHYLGINVQAQALHNIKFKTISEDSVLITQYNADVVTGVKSNQFPAGSGWGFDLGFIWQKKKQDVYFYTPNTGKGNCEFNDYKYKLGVSLLDIGSINFNNNINVYSYSGQGSELTSNEAAIFYAFDTLNPFRSNETKINKPSSILLPSALSIQFDYNYRNGIYLNLSAILATNNTKRFKVKRPSSITFTPRYESKHIEVSFPVSWYDFSTLRIGASVRLSQFFFLGIERWDGIIKSDVSGIGIYGGIKYSVFYHPKCKNKFKLLDLIKKNKACVQPR